MSLDLAAIKAHLDDVFVWDGHHESTIEPVGSRRRHPRGGKRGVNMAWTRFYDTSSVGSEKLDHGTIYIEAKEPVARMVFALKFNRDPDNVTCECCGSDYSVTEDDSCSSEWDKSTLRINADEVKIILGLSESGE